MNLLPDKWIPKDIPKPLIMALIIACLFIGLSGMRHRGWEGVLHTLENWLVMLVFIPSCIALITMPIKYRDHTFDIKMAYYMGMFVALLFMMGKLRYWR